MYSNENPESLKSDEKKAVAPAGNKAIFPGKNKAVWPSGNKRHPDALKGNDRDSS